ncbi:uncharacterized protein BXZ73DRAFT_42645 [Epithele typhae]|uniref:uncharacterized protein n=1 Tax=Epithele typhae TaxID=378194 RepID=UPI002007D7CE|nr:uncharacterized protein BXZ73DRAFT_42645 [Epithele typhae]KAH9940361.1 hypothetical protein BXZ73DRAFT_42645 [Epithele typhae]
MDPKPLADQERDIKNLLSRAKSTPLKTSSLRRDTLRRLIDLAHSEHTSLKITAAENFRYFIKDFPDLEDDAINAVYDLCEDPVYHVRIKGYAAIVDVSREQSKWVKRNADVLIQLLQSDNPDEVVYVKRSLTQHLDMDPVVTMGVVFDQIIPPEEPLDDEEVAIRDRLRSLVLAFLAGEVKRPLGDRHIGAAGSPAERFLVTEMFKAIPKLNVGEVETIVKDVLVALPSFKPPSARGTELLDVILSQTRAAVKSDLAENTDRASFSEARAYLALALFACIDKRIAPSTHLLNFYFNTIALKQVLERISEEAQSDVIVGISRTLAVWEETKRRTPPTAPATDLRNSEDSTLLQQSLDVGAILFQVCLIFAMNFANDLLITSTGGR